MSELVSQFLNATGTYLILGAADITPQPRDSRQFVPCPECNHAAYIAGPAIVCSGKHCCWRVGSAVDYVASAKGQSVRQVVNLVRTAYPEKTNTIGGVPWFEIVDKVVHAFEQQNALRQFLLTRSGMPEKLTQEMAVADGWLSKNGVSIHDTQSTMFLLNAEECVALAERVATLTGRTPPDWSYECGAIVTVLLSDFLTISRLLLSPLHPHPATSKALLWDVAPTRTSFSGLWECRTGVLNTARFLSNTMIAAALRESQSDLQPGVLHLGLYTSTSVLAETPLRFERAGYLLNRDKETLKSMMDLKLLVSTNGLSAGYRDAPATMVPWSPCMPTVAPSFTRVPR